MKSEDSFKLGLVLAGSAINHVQEICTALMDVFRFSPDLSLVGIDSVDCSGFSNPVLTGNSYISFDRLATMSVEDILAVSVLSPDHVNLNFLTPLCIVQDGTAIREFSFSKFITSLLRRISSLAYYYGGSVPGLDYKRLSALSKEMRVFDSNISYFGRTGWKKEGLLGSCLVTGDLSEFHPLLLLGEYLHCGKGAAYGMGSYVIVRDNLSTHDSLNEV
ncbi:MAG: CRISPR system precrRNA processing endoribonuclease RAMP protein Cas6 [Geobacteraceae bacterium]|nr:CRISPR system precrRNA processing endoribonuclease RAMP protein Cas6 [Geobacteraceae bacterium]